MVHLINKVEKELSGHISGMGEVSSLGCLCHQMA